MKKLLTVLLSCLLVFSLVGCSEKPADTASDASGKVHIRFMVNGSAAELALYQKAVDAFNAQSETTEVEMIGDSGDDFAAVLITQLSTNEAPDVFYSDDSSFGEMNKSGVLLDITNYLNDSSSRLTADQVPDSAKYAFEYDGGIRGVPVDANPEVIYFNRGLFEELGIKTPTEYDAEGQWTLENFEKVMTELNKAGKYPFVWENWWGPIYSFLINKGDKLFDGTKANFDNDRVNYGMNFIEKNFKSGNIIWAGTLESGESADSLFMAGDTGMVYSGRWSLPDYSETSINFDTVIFPYYEKRENATNTICSTAMVINKACANPDNAWEFVSFYCGAEGQRVRMEGQGNAVPTVPGLEDIYVTGVPANSTAYKDAMANGFYYSREEFLHPGLSDAINGEIEKLLVGDQDAAATVTAMQSVAEELLAE